MTDITESPGALKAMIEQLLDTIAYQQKRIEYLAQACLEHEEAYLGALKVIDEMEADAKRNSDMYTLAGVKAQERIAELEALTVIDEMDDAASQKTH